jgi:hypothetical protein
MILSDWELENCWHNHSGQYDLDLGVFKVRNCWKLQHTQYSSHWIGAAERLY